jgi:hypothetical protein
MLGWLASAPSNFLEGANQFARDLDTFAANNETLKSFESKTLETLEGLPSSLYSGASSVVNTGTSAVSSIINFSPLGCLNSIGIYTDASSPTASQTAGSAASPPPPVEMQAKPADIDVPVTEARVAQDETEETSTALQDDI